jgi:hypothetical protein
LGAVVIQRVSCCYYFTYLPEQVVSAQCPLEPEVDVCGAEALILLPWPAAVPAPAGPLREHEVVVVQKPPIPPPLHAIVPFAPIIQLACAVCTGIILTTITVATVAVRRASITAVIALPVNTITLLLAVLVFEFAIIAL